VAEYRYLIVGGGMTADAACRGIRDHDSKGSIGLFGEESHEPYARPPLTKALWKGKPEDSIWRGTPSLGVDLHPGRTIVSLDLDGRTATDDAGETHSY
jgi:3-phenylpropionate/trans-cinnamate dioxygenase ferredoxin reductase component